MQIIEAAGELISFSGYWAVSLNDIGVRCGVTNAAVLHHFGSKEKLLMAVLAHRDEVDRIALATGLGVERADLYTVLPTIDLSMICAAMVRRNAQQPEIVRLYALLSAESLDPHHPAHEYYQKREATQSRFDRSCCRLGACLAQDSLGFLRWRGGFDPTHATAVRLTSAGSVHIRDPGAFVAGHLGPKGF